MEQEMLSMATADRRLRLLPFAPPYRRLSPPHYYKNSGDYSVFSPKGSSTPITPASSVSFDDVEDPAATEDRLYLAGLRLQCQEFAGRYELCVTHLQEAAREAEALRLENAQLRMANGELAKRLTGWSSSPATAAAISMADEIRKLRIESSPPAVDSPTSVLEPRVSLPKSISVRSTGYKKLSSSDQGGSNNGRIRVSKPVMAGSQRVYVGGGAGDSKKAPAEAAGAVELEVYNQGMFKTELCNKWQETGGECPYGEHCQFAHGIGELRPIIRHPRYKTEVCRMVLNGDSCPYGHRCHFRHALSPSDQ